MSFFDRETFQIHLGQWPGVTFVDQWDARVAKVGDKVFCLFSNTEPQRIVFKSGEASFDILTALEGVEQAPYLAKRQWVSARESAPLSHDEIAAYIRRSHDLVASGLTKKLRSALGIDLG